MVSKEKLMYEPDYITKPGLVLENYLDSLGMSQSELSKRIDLTTKTINKNNRRS